MRSLFAILFLCSSYSLQAQKLGWIWDAQIKKIYNAASALQPQLTHQYLEEGLASQPNNAYLVYMANYTDFYNVFFNESPSDLKPYLKKADLRLRLLAKSNPESPMYKHSQAMIYLQNSLAQVKFKEYMSAAKQMRSAYKLLKENKESYPNWIEGDLAITGIEYAVGSLPNSYAWAVRLFGFNGAKQINNTKLDALIANKDGLFYDRLFFYVYIQQYLLNNKAKALSALLPFKKECVKNRLLTFMVCNIALNQNNSALAAEVLESHLAQSGFMPLPILNYELGTAYLNKLDDRCVNQLLKYTQNYKGKFYVADAYYKIALYYYAKGNSAQYLKYKAAILQVPPSDADADKSAQQFAAANETPALDIPQLEARLYNDGGYHQLALAALQKSNNAQSLEYIYRKAKIFMDLNITDSAQVYFLRSYQLGRNRKEYFGAKSALYLGNLCEEKGDKANAIKYYQLCIDCKNHSSESSLEQKAKAGIQRCK